MYDCQIYANRNLVFTGVNFVSSGVNWVMSGGNSRRSRDNLLSPMPLFYFIKK